MGKGATSRRSSCSSGQRQNTEEDEEEEEEEGEQLESCCAVAGRPAKRLALGARPRAVRGTRGEAGASGRGQAGKIKRKWGRVDLGVDADGERARARCAERPADHSAAPAADGRAEGGAAPPQQRLLRSAALAHSSAAAANPDSRRGQRAARAAHLDAPGGALPLQRGPPRRARRRPARADAGRTAEMGKRSGACPRGSSPGGERWPQPRRPSPRAPPLASTSSVQLRRGGRGTWNIGAASISSARRPSAARAQTPMTRAAVLARRPRAPLASVARLAASHLPRLAARRPLLCCPTAPGALRHVCGPLSARSRRYLLSRVRRLGRAATTRTARLLSRVRRLGHAAATRTARLLSTVRRHGHVVTARTARLLGCLRRHGHAAMTRTARLLRTVRRLEHAATTLAAHHPSRARSLGHAATTRAARLITLVRRLGRAATTCAARLLSRVRRLGHAAAARAAHDDLEAVSDELLRLRGVLEPGCLGHRYEAWVRAAGRLRVRAAPHELSGGPVLFPVVRDLTIVWPHRCAIKAHVLA
ncbi:unnamed protein product [Prorocentrum cordatum]|uniref:Uncharacterized protein n=1 Tax=Prorocentrum cordatum TaxID=2364126 RepID=A0ABN9TM31_9DINO|nr:unnamed protein product [Polarella glacialis]